MGASPGFCRRWSPPYANDAQRLPNFAAFATRAGKVLFAGEFGTTPADRTNYAAML